MESTRKGLQNDRSRCCYDTKVTPAATSRSQKLNQRRHTRLGNTLIIDKIPADIPSTLARFQLATIMLFQVCLE